MKRLWLLAAFLAFLIPTGAQQVPATANLTAQDSGACTTANACLSVNIPKDGASSVIQLSGTWTATVQFEASTGAGANGSPFTAITGTPVGGTGAVSSATANGAWRFNVSSVYVIRVRVASFSGGTVQAAITASLATTFSSLTAGGGGGGSGTIGGGGTACSIPIFTDATDLGNSNATDCLNIFQSTDPVAQPASLYQCTNSASGTTNGLLVTRDSNGNCINLPNGQTTKVVGVVFSGGGTSGIALICKIGTCPITMDNTSVIDDCIIPAATGARGHDAGATCPTAIQQIGIAQNVNLGPGTSANGDVFISDIQSGPSGPVQTIQVGGVTLAGTFPNFNNTTPAAQANFLNCFFQTDNGTPTSNVSLECPEATASQEGFVKLAQDFGGTNLLPRVVGIQTIPVTFTTPAVNDVICFPTTSTLANCHPGVPIRTFATGSDTMLSTDRTGWVRPTNAGTVAETLPQAGSAGFTSNYVFGYLNNATGIATITPTTSTINGAATLPVYPGWFALTTSDNTNYFSALMPTSSGFPPCPDVTGNHLNFTTAAGISCGTSGGGGGGGGTLTSVSGSSPIVATPNPIVATGALSCPTCAVANASLTSGKLIAGAGGQAEAIITTPTQCGAGQAAAGITDTGAANGCFIPGGAGTVTSITTTAPVSGCSSPCTTTATIGITANGITATQLAVQYAKGSCTELWGGSGTSFALTSGDDSILNNGCYNDSGVTRTITAVKCRSDVGSNTTTVNPTFGSAGTGTTILSGALTCGSSLAYSSTGTVSNASWTTGTGINPAMSGTLTGTSIAMIIEYTF